MRSDMQAHQFGNAANFEANYNPIYQDLKAACGAEMKTKARREAEAAIMELHQTGEIMRTCQRITQGNQLAEDLAQETILILLQKPAKQINEMHQRNQLRWYTTRLIMILWRGAWSDFTAKYRHFEPILENPENQAQTQEQEYNTTIDRLIEIMEAEMDSWAKQGEFPYEKSLLLEVTEAGSMTKISKQTKIPYRSVVWTIEKAKNKIKKQLKKHGYDSISIDS